MNAELPPPIAPPRKKWKAILLLIVVFALGGIAGIGGTTLVIMKRVQANLKNPVVAENVGNRFLSRVNRNIDKELKLNPEQQVAVRQELDVTRERLGEIRVSVLRDLRGLAGDTLERISKRLPEEKRALLRERFRDRLRPWGVEPPEPEKPQ